MFTAVLMAHLHTPSCDLFLICSEKRRLCYIQGINMKCEWGYCHCIRKYMLTWDSYLCLLGINIFSLQSHAAARAFHVRGTKDLATMCARWAWEASPPLCLVSEPNLLDLLLGPAHTYIGCTRLWKTTLSYHILPTLFDSIEVKSKVAK